MASERKAMLERVQPLREALEELQAAHLTVVVQVAREAGQQAAGAQAVQVLTECTRRLREIIAEFYPDDVEDDDEAV